MLDKRRFQLYSISGVATRELRTVASILKIVISRNTKRDNLVSFPKSGHNYFIVVYLIFVSHDVIKKLRFMQSIVDNSIL